MKSLRLWQVFLIFTIVSTAAGAQSEQSEQSARSGAYLIPHQIFVGDPATFILPLPGTIAENQDIVLTPLSPGFPSHPDIDFNRIIFERRVGGSRLMIEFTAFVPGLLELPVIEAGGESFSEITVMVNSIIDNRSAPELFGAASPLTMPGTTIMIYGTMGIIVFIIIFTMWFVLRGKRLLQSWNEKRKRRKAFRIIKKTERNLYKAVLKGEDSRVILDKLSEQFRIFLSFLTGINCRAMTAREFENLPQEFVELSLSDFFRNCDKLRFSGINIEKEKILLLLDDLREFLFILENKEKEKNNAKKNTQEENTAI